MASIGEVSAKLTADVSQYVGAMQQASASTTAIQQSVENATASLVKEGAAGAEAGKGLASFGASTQAVAAQLAQAEGRLVQLQSAFTTLGIPAKGREFARASEEVARLRAQLAATAPAAAQLAQAGSQVAPQVARLTASSAQGARTLATLRGSLANLASTAVGVPGPIGAIASKLLMFGAGGGVTVAVLAGLSLLATAWSKWRETVVKEGEVAAAAWERTLTRMRNADKFADLIDERVAATQRLAAAQEELRRSQETQQTVETAEGPVTIRTPIDPARVAAATLELGKAKAALEDIGKAIAGVATEQREAAADAIADARQVEEATKRAFLPTQAQQDAKAMLDKIATSLRAIKAEQAAIAATALEIRTEESEKRVATLQAAIDEMKKTLRETEETARDKALEAPKSDNTIKDAIENGRQDAVESMRGVANSMARAFTDAFSDNQKSIMERVVSVLGAALREAVERVIAQKIFEGLLAAVTGGASKGIGGVPIIGDIFSGFFAPPSLPSPEQAVAQMGSGNTIVVPLDRLPPPLSPVEVARDAQHQTIWMETARVAEANGYRLMPRFR